MGKILDATEQLFGERVMGSPARYPDPARLLAAIAEAYQNRRALRKPARVVFSNLRYESNISSKYLADPCAYLPESFLAAVGLPRSPASSESDYPDYSDYLIGLPDYEVDEEVENQDPPSFAESHPSLSLLVAEHPARTAIEAWVLANAVLESELDRDPFHRILAGSTLARFDPFSNTFTIAVEESYTRDWLQERCTKLIGRLLNGICARPASVLFVMGKQVVEEISDV